MNAIIISGNLVRPSVITSGESEKGQWSLEKFTVAEGGGNDGKTPANYFLCEWWNGNSKQPHDIGTHVEITGHIKTDTWENGDGKRVLQKVIVDRCIFYAKNTTNNAGENNT